MVNGAASLCVGCFETPAVNSACPSCGYEESHDRSPVFLSPGTLLRSHYLVGRALGRPGGVGITYLAFDTSLETKVAIKEYLPRGISGRHADRLTVGPHSEREIESFRHGLDEFLREARTLAHFDHPNIVRVRNYFEENGTAYLVMDYVEGVSLAEYVQKKGGKISEKLAVDIMMPILDGLREVHDMGFLHRDIKPQNIHISAAGRPLLLDFGAARFEMSQQTRDLSVLLTPGFAPWEQYHLKGEQGAWTDIYAIAATLYSLACGVVPQESSDRRLRDEVLPPARLEPRLSESFSRAVMSGLALDPEMRPQTVHDFQAMLMRTGSRTPGISRPAVKVRQLSDGPSSSQLAPSAMSWSALFEPGIALKLAIPVVLIAVLIVPLLLIRKPAPAGGDAKDRAAPSGRAQAPGEVPAARATVPPTVSRGSPANARPFGHGVPASDLGDLQLLREANQAGVEARFERHGTDVIHDKTTHLDWIVGPVLDTTYDQAVDWVSGLLPADGGWRMPTNEEVLMLCTRRDTNLHLDPIFGSSIRLDSPTAWVWTRYLDSANAEYVALESTSQHMRSRTDAQYGRAFAVRQH